MITNALPPFLWFTVYLESTLYEGQRTWTSTCSKEFNTASPASFRYWDLCHIKTDLINLVFLVSRGKKESFRLDWGLQDGPWSYFFHKAAAECGHICKGTLLEICKEVLLQWHSKVFLFSTSYRWNSFTQEDALLVDSFQNYLRQR